METKEAINDARRFALIALSVFVLDKTITACLWIFEGRVSFLERIPAIPITGIFFSWGIPFLIVYRVEKKDRKSLGLAIGRERYLRYGLYAAIGLMLPAILVGIDGDLILEFVEQIAYIGLAEEVFFRGYLMTRLCKWLGDHKGLFLNGFLFGLSHVISLVSQHGLKYPARDASVGLYTFLGGLLNGYMYLKARNIVPPALLHVSTNMYLSRIMEILNW